LPHGCIFAEAQSAAFAGFRVLDWRVDMAPDGVSSRGDLWLSIRREAETALARDPIFGRSLSASILGHPDLGAAVSHQIGQRLGKSTGDRHQFERAANEAFAASPDLVDAASRDLEVIVLNDPASTGPLPVLLNFKGYVALQIWRVSNWLWRQNRRDLALLLQSESSDSLQVSIHPSASDRHIGVPGSCHRHRGRLVREHRRRGDHSAERHGRAESRKSEPRAKDRQRRPAQHGGNHSWRRQHR
jgi:Serine acetyltransferase